MGAFPNHDCGWMGHISMLEVSVTVNDINDAVYLPSPHNSAFVDPSTREEHVPHH